ncbi:MAG: adenylate/guanylate cyclase domain-containing protein, partial [Rhodobacteraceae bacterium]
MQRRLAAIMAADVVGYSAMMGRDEQGTLAALRAFRTSDFHPIVTSHGGTVIKSMGDGWLVEFASVVDAVTAAMRLQDTLADQRRDLTLRFGVHIGDITRDGEDIFGDGVNIAARLEALARPGQLLISDPAYGSLDGTLSPAFDDLGETRLKNIARPLRVWARMPAAPVAHTPAQTPSDDGSGYPRLVIQPFSTSDPRPEIAEIAGALTSDIQTYLGQLAWLNARIGESHGPGAYRLQAVLRARGDRLRLEARLFSPDGSEAWTAKFDGDLSDAFDWQDKVGEDIASELIGITLDTETRRLSGLAPRDMTAEQAFLAGMMTWRSYAPEAFYNALVLHRRAIEANPDLI